MTVGLGAQNVKFSHLVFVDVRDIEYSYFCTRSSNLFGCVGLKDKKYCILNKQYSEPEYNELREKIIEHMDKVFYTDKKGRVYRYGEFFPLGLSPFAYNESIVHEYFPMTREEVLVDEYSWREPEKKEREIEIKARDLPESIIDAGESVTNRVIGCEHEGNCNHQCTFAFRIIPQELKFYKKMNLPLPRLCPKCRHFERIEERNPLKLWHSKCQCAGQKDDKGTYQNTAKHFHGAEHCPNEFET